MRKFIIKLLQASGLLEKVKRIIIIYTLPYYRHLQHKNLKKLKSKKEINVVYFISSLPMWRYQGVYDKLRKDKRFKQTVVIYPNPIYTKQEYTSNQNILRTFFNNNDILNVLLDDSNSKKQIDSFCPDILFFDQPYSDKPAVNIALKFYKDKLLAYLPYGFANMKGSGWRYNNPLQNYAWKLYYSSTIQKAEASKGAYNKGDNIVVVGEPHTDDFVNCRDSNMWKNITQKKRIIWAPHFRIVSNELLNRPSFLWTYDYMLTLAQSKQNEIQIAFKPHPLLYSELCRHPDWGEKRANEYYEKWRTMPNTQLETGNFIELFIGSDALIHDCGSFTSEYMFVKKPCLFLTKSPQDMPDSFDEFGKKCFDLHDIASNTGQISQFVDKIIDNAPDTKFAKRTAFYNEYLLPPNNKSVSQNIYEDIVNSIFA